MTETLQPVDGPLPTAADAERTAERAVAASRVRHLSHTAIEVEHGTSVVLIDPVLVLESPDLRDGGPPRWPPGDPSRVDAIVVSHAHDDHLHPPSLLWAPPTTPLWCYGDAGCRKATALGFTAVHRLTPGASLEVAPAITVTVVAAEPSVDGTEQCAFIIETPDLVLLDAVDIRDTPLTRAALERYRGRVDLAFVPAGASVQPDGGWNQMDLHGAASFAGWLDAAHVGICGGAASSARPRRLGEVQRYPSTMADWYAVAGQVLQGDRLLRRGPPVELDFVAHNLVRSGPPPRHRDTGGAGVPAVQALVAAYFTGYRPDAPAQRVPGHGLERIEALSAAWDGQRDTIRRAAGQLTSLLARCDRSVDGTAAASLAPNTVRHLLATDQLDVAAELTTVIPRFGSAGPDLDGGFFDHAEAIVRTVPAPATMAEALCCLDFDRRLHLLGVEHHSLRRHAHGGSDTERQRHLLEQLLHDLRRTADRRRPVLGPNVVWLSAADAPLLSGRPLAPDTVAELHVATVDGVVAVPLAELEALIVQACNGRTAAEVARDLATGLAADYDLARTATVELLLQLTAVAPQLLDWSG